MRGRANIRPFLIWTGLLIVVLPVIFVAFLSIPVVSRYISGTLKIDNKSFIDIAINYMSLAISIILGIIVYCQSQQINNLEISQYDTYLGIEGLDYSFDFGNYLAVDKTQSKFNNAYFFSSEKKVLLTSINIATARGKPLLLPLVFVTKNQPLIVSFAIKSINISVKEKHTEIYSRTFPIGGERIKTILKDDSRFIVGFGMIVPIEKVIDEIHLCFLINVEDQNNYKQDIQSKVSLLRIDEESDFVITSSYSSLIR